MRRSRFGIGAGFMMALAGLVGASQNAALATVKLSDAVNKMQDNRATKAEAQRYAVSADTRAPFDPVANLFHDAGMSPKEYGIRFGTGASRKGKCNRLAYGHRAKLGRRV